jgi:methionyl-tRNA formyltransferase
MKKINIAVFADREIGKSLLNILLKKKKYSLKFIICTKKNKKIFDQFPVKKIVFEKKTKIENWKLINNSIKSNNIKALLLLWCPYIVPNNVCKINDLQIINVHPSYLPYGRGKDANFWSIVENETYGVSIMEVNKEIDSGNYFIRKKINYNYLDNGFSLYKIALKEIKLLFKNNIFNILDKKIISKKQNLTIGSYHKRKDMKNISEIKLNKLYKAKDLINILRAKMFPNHSSAFFVHNKKKYFLKIKIENEKK